MKRRDAIRLFPLSLAGMAGVAGGAFGQTAEKRPFRPGIDEPLAVQYSKKAKERLTWIRQNQSENLMEAAYTIARTVESGGQCYQAGWDAGHTEADSWPGRNGEPEILSTSWNPEKAKKGDLLLTSGQKNAEEIAKKGVFIIGCPSPWSGDARNPEMVREDVQKMKLRPYADIFIETQATTVGGLVNLPGMPAPMGPISGLTGKTTIWMMLADTCRILAKKGISRPVRGDEPKVNGSDTPDYKTFAGWAKLSDPLMDDYFTEVINQLDMVFAEMGTIRKIAAMAVDSVLKGGHIYGYSRYNSVAGEADTRRSGLSITQGCYGFRFTSEDQKKKFPGNANDCVIMGITKPDDEVDLAMLDLFKSRGMKIASIGPMTRSIQVPKGRTVPKETDYHAGRMCDTYGLFAVKGFDQRICPTSGVVLDHLFWITMMEVAEQFITRTGGDIPGVFYSGALKGGMENFFRMLETYRDQRYK